MKQQQTSEMPNKQTNKRNRKGLNLLQGAYYIIPKPLPSSHMTKLQSQPNVMKFHNSICRLFPEGLYSICACAIRFV